MFLSHHVKLSVPHHFMSIPWTTNWSTKKSMKMDVWPSWEMALHPARNYCIHAIGEKGFDKLINLSLFFFLPKCFCHSNLPLTLKQCLSPMWVDAQPRNLWDTQTQLFSVSRA